MESRSSPREGHADVRGPSWERFVAPAVFIVSAAVGWYAANRVESGATEPLTKAFFVLTAAMAAHALSSLVVYFWRRGRVLVDLGRRPGARAIWFVMPLLIGYWVWRLATTAVEKRWDASIWILLLLWLGIRNISRVQLVERGLWSDGSLIPWRSIRSVAWDERDRGRLKLKWGGWLGGSQKIDVPEEKREIVERILEERVPARGAS